MSPPTGYSPMYLRSWPACFRRKWCADLCQTYPCTEFSLGLMTHSLGIIAHWLLLERDRGFEPPTQLWKSCMLPLHQSRIYAAYSAATAPSSARSCLFNLATMRPLPPFFVSLSSLSAIKTFFISISCCVIILIFLLMIYSLLSKIFTARSE